MTETSLPLAKIIEVHGVKFAVGLQWLRLHPQRLTRDAEKLARQWNADAFALRRGFTPQVGIAGGFQSKIWSRVRAAAPAAVDELGAKWLGLWTLPDGGCWGVSCVNGEILADGDRVFSGRDQALDWLHSELAVIGDDYRVISPEGWYQGAEHVPLDFLRKNRTGAPVLIPRHIYRRMTPALLVGGVSAIATVYFLAPAINGIFENPVSQNTSSSPSPIIPAPENVILPLVSPPEPLPAPDPPSFALADFGAAIHQCIDDLELVAAMLPPSWKGVSYSCAPDVVEAVATTTAVSARVAAAMHLERIAPSGSRWELIGDSGRELKLVYPRAPVNARGSHELVRLMDAELALRDISDYWDLKISISTENWQHPASSDRVTAVPSWKSLKWEVSLPFAVEHLGNERVFGALPGMVLTRLIRDGADRPWRAEGRIYVQ
ncbi:type 4b pilus protein PilO2 [Niveispirillum sp. SYP-B3756]|uniref:type 4b pilus protein PilO2 n=1 Tax=Niveispirillum sp. SYP-B3756 TaxID=2662178 RepID=UPI0012925A95|nr:type 4b pilus protein PilO2 [Niveispirillum sp. SYP-B3756]MQP68212.1 type 4b pilus protein PilO2 [Niveispirillum sp. SYP-B3756]